MTIIKWLASVCNLPTDIEMQLAEANRRLTTASAALAPKHRGGEWEEFNSAQSEVLRLERELAKSRKEPYAVPCGFPIKWDIGAPLPFLLCNDDKTFLTFYVHDPDPKWDGTYVKVVDPDSSEAAKLCLVTFKNCVSAKLGHPNDEALRGHPLAGHGLEGYTAQFVKNSRWIEEVAKINSVHHRNDPARWKLLNHYIFWFHDSTFECLAESYEVEITLEPMDQLLRRVQAKLLK
ncbi:MAG: hypothetical protein HQM09_24605 [Candidatus Riflebacteria bacterium]|nr:hypothetical protein [Candidatus Riflebacteria bacterium]